MKKFNCITDLELSSFIFLKCNLKQDGQKTNPGLSIGGRVEMNSAEALLFGIPSRPAPKQCKGKT